MEKLEVVNIRLVKDPYMLSNIESNNPQKVLEVLAKEFALYDREVFAILNMDTKMKIINMNVVSVGSINTTIAEPREVFKSSILSNAFGIIVIHNHPSGNTTPSESDIITTKRLAEAGAILGIPVVDHIIVGGSNSKLLSFREEGMLNVYHSPEEQINESPEFIQNRNCLARR